MSNQNKTIKDLFGIIDRSKFVPNAKTGPNNRLNHHKESQIAKRSHKRTKLDVEEVSVVMDGNKYMNSSNSSDSQRSTASDVKRVSPSANWSANSADTRKSANRAEQLLKRVFAFDGYRSRLQREAIECVIGGQHDVFISMPTGAGKSLCYQLPSVCDNCEDGCDPSGVTIVVSPLIALIANQVSVMKKMSIRAETINSHLPPNEQKRIKNDLMTEKTNISLLYITPEMAATSGFAIILEHLFKSQQLRRIAIDEAHCVSQWGHDFRPDYLKLGRIKERYPQIAWIALTATASAKVVDDIIALLKLRTPVSKFISPNFRANLFYDVVYKDLLKEPLTHLKEFLMKEIGPKDLPNPKRSPFCTANDYQETGGDCEKAGVGIVYCRTRAVCEDIADSLSRFGIKCFAYHAGLSAHQRRDIQEKWMSGRVKCITATVSFGMGVDKASVRFVVHWNLPQSLTGYYQESGRAGRDGQPAKCRIYYSVDDRNAITFLLKHDSEKKINESISKGEQMRKLSEVDSREAMKRFEKMVNYCEHGSKCRHSSLLSEFVGDDSVIRMGCKSSCDVCTQPNKVNRSVQEFESFLQRKLMNKTQKRVSNATEEDDWSLPKHDSPQHVGSTSKDEKEISMTSIIRGEFKKRKQAAKSVSSPQAPTYIGFRRATEVLEGFEVLEPANNRIKDLDLNIRNQFVNKLIEEYQRHYNEVQYICRPLQISNKQIIETATKAELNIYKTRNNKMMYRTAIAQIIRQLKKDTEASTLNDSLKELSVLVDSELKVENICD